MIDAVAFRVRSLEWFMRGEDAVLARVSGLGSYERTHQKWLRSVERHSANIRRRRARALYEKGAEVYRERLRAHVASETIRAEEWDPETGEYRAQWVFRNRALSWFLGTRDKDGRRVPRSVQADRLVERVEQMEERWRISTPEQRAEEAREFRGALGALRMPDAEPDPLTGAPVNKWHAARAAGLERRFERMRTCHHSKTYVVRTCGHWATRYRLGCNQRTCNRCRKARANAIRKPFQYAREQLRAEAKRRRVSYVVREKMLTLTVPHVGSATERVELLFKAWGGTGRHSFAECLRELAAQAMGAQWDKVKDIVHTFRVFEWTEGSRHRKNDGAGHPHFHLWLHGPFLAVKLVQAAWELAVKRAASELGLTLPESYRAIVWLNAARDGIENELIKYLVKDLSATSHARFVSSPTMAAVLMALDGRRTRQVSAGFKRFEVKPLAKDPVTGQWLCNCGCGAPLRFDLMTSQKKLAPRVWVGLPALAFDDPDDPPLELLGCLAGEPELANPWSSPQIELPF